MDRVALISGGTSGVGLVAAEALLRDGYTVVVNGRDRTNGERALAYLDAPTGRAFFELGDADQYDSISDVVRRIFDQLGRVDVLISAGSTGRPGPTLFSDMTPAQLVEGLLTRVCPRMYPVHAVVPVMRKIGGGAIVMLTSDAARVPTPGEAIVGAAGAAVISLTKGLARELSPSFIRVNAVAMTITADTPSWDRMFKEDSFQKRLFEKAVARFPMGRPPNAAEVAEVISFLASDRSRQVTGQTISVNGGLSFGGW